MTEKEAYLYAKKITKEFLWRPQIKKKMEDEGYTEKDIKTVLNIMKRLGWSRR